MDGDVKTGFVCMDGRDGMIFLDSRFRGNDGRLCVGLLLRGGIPTLRSQ